MFPIQLDDHGCQSFKIKNVNWNKCVGGGKKTTIKNSSLFSIHKKIPNTNKPLFFLDAENLLILPQSEVNAWKIIC